MNRVNNGLVLVIIMLMLVILSLGIYIIYDKLLDDGNSKVGDNDKLLSVEEAKIIVKNLEEKYFDYTSWLGPYCGEWNTDDYISFGSYETNDFRDYYASDKFSSIAELKEYLEVLLVSELISKYINDGVSYIEQDGKLYCQIPHKGGGFARDYDVVSTYNILSIKEDTIISDVTFWGYDMSVELSSLNATVTIVKNDDDKWLVSKYEINY